MATICQWCDEDMQRAKGCIPHLVVVGKVAHPSIPFGKEKGFGSIGTRCHDCNALVGHQHHLWCDMEECPVCHEQFILCEHGQKGR